MEPSLKSSLLCLVNLKELIPLTSSLSETKAYKTGNYKGQNGKVAIVGGSKDYTGAPYYAAKAALSSGADLSTIYCPSEASIPIKSYSPELVVEERSEESEVSASLTLKHTVVFGPGYGREGHKYLYNSLNEVLKKQMLNVILDADALWYLQNGDVGHEFESLLSEHRSTGQGVILTPNKIEFMRLWEAVIKDPGEGKYLNEAYPDKYKQIEEDFASELYTKIKNNNFPDIGTLSKDHPMAEDVVKMSDSLYGVTILKKGAIDIISDGEEVVYVANQGSRKRCGGQGDVLAGIIGVMAHYTRSASNVDEIKAQLEGSDVGYTQLKMKSEICPNIRSPTVLAAAIGSYITREAARIAYQKHKIGTIAPQVLDEVSGVINSLIFDEEIDEQSQVKLMNKL